ncbi:RICIN domain-containing protein [Streptomyces sp. NPDC005500]|uniref:RICIN domain-containing protein n=1 Tax=Streptomyces sp. NPDC005500 TaxID=3155007 RepID=UPI0033A527F8
MHLLRRPRALVGLAISVLAALAVNAAPAAASGTYYQGRTVFESSNRVWTATGGSGGEVVYAASTGSAAQQWDVVQASGRPTRQVNYVNRGTGLCLDVEPTGPSGQFTLGARIVQQPCTSSLSQVWELRTDWDPFLRKAYAVENKLSLLSLTVEGASGADNAALVQDDLLGGWGGSHQFWHVTPVA